MSRDNGNAVVRVTAEGPMVKGARLAARTLALVLLLLVAVFAVYEGVPNPFQLTLREWMCDGGFLLVVAGLVAAWWFERTGGLVVIFGYLLFVIANVPITGTIWPGRSVVFPLTGLLFLIARKRRPS